MKHDILFMNDKLVNQLSGGMPDIIHDVERALSLLDSGEALNPEKAVMKWGKRKHIRTYQCNGWICRRRI